MIQQEYETVESFVRYGPVERVRKARRDYLGVYPWRAHANGRLVVSSVKPHYREIVRFINDHLDAVSQSTLFNKLDASTLFYVVYWIVFLCLAVTLSTLTEYVQSLVPEASSSDIKNKIYCMELAGWIGRLPYSGYDYFYTYFDADPFEYSFKGKSVIATVSVAN